MRFDLPIPELLTGEKLLLHVLTGDVLGALFNAFFDAAHAALHGAI